MRVGDIEVIPVSDGTATMPPAYFPNADWGPHQDLLNADGNITIPLGCFVIRTGDTTVLVDAGIGPFSNPIFDGGKLPGALEAAGVTRDQIDIVVCTHLHLDHAGWLVQDGEPFFPNATVRFGEGDWQQFVVEGEAPPWILDAMLLLAERDRVQPIDHDTEQIAPGVTSRFAPGHTHGHQVLVVSSQGQRLVLLGDAVTCPVQLEEPDWQAMSDVDKDLATRTREALWRELEGTDDIAVASHFPDLQFGRVLAGEGKRWFVST